METRTIWFVYGLQTNIHGQGVERNEFLMWTGGARRTWSLWHLELWSVSRVPWLLYHLWSLTSVFSVWVKDTFKTHFQLCFHLALQVCFSLPAHGNLSGLLYNRISYPGKIFFVLVCNFSLFSEKLTSFGGKPSKTENDRQKRCLLLQLLSKSKDSAMVLVCHPRKYLDHLLWLFVGWHVMRQ